MRPTLLLFFSLVTTAVASAAKDAPPSGFTALFNGHDLTGWYGWPTKDPSELWKMTPVELADYKRKSIEGGLPVGPPGPQNIAAHWRVENGEIVSDGKGLNLTTDKDYGDFELLVESKALADGDSGINLRGVPQVQIWGAAKNLAKKMDQSFGAWNRIHITVIGERATVIFDGHKIVDNAVLENYFAERKTGDGDFGAAEKSERQKLPNGFMQDPVFPKGPIQLQTSGSEIRWRNLYIREIGSEEANQRLAAAGGEDGFVEQVNGQDLSNWQGAVDSYEMKHGAIVCRPKKGGDLLTKDEFENGIIRVEFKLPVAGNNGIALRTPLGGHSASDGFEIQVIDSDGYNALQAAAGKKGLLPYQYHGSLYYCVGAKHGYLRPVGEWNFEEIEVHGQKISVTLNGTKILDVNIDTFDRSQLAFQPKGLDHTRGFIGFAGHNDPVEFRSFKVKKM